MAGSATPAPLEWLSSSGLDVSAGGELVQARIALFAKILLVISLAFLVVGSVAGALFETAVTVELSPWMTVGHLVGLAFITAVWLVARRGKRSLWTLELLDATALVVCCTAWALFIDVRFEETVHGAIISVAITTMARAICVPSTAARTLRVSIAAVIPVLVMLWVWLRHAVAPGQPARGPFSPWFTAINQTLVMVVVVTMVTITSRILYDLRRRVREANELGQYTLEDKLGSGGMGEVWRARHRFLVRAAAVKLIRPEILSSGRADPDTVLRRFEREALATAALTSPHTVQLYDFGQAEDGTLFYVMELLGGIDLENLVERYGPVPAERAVHILKQVCHSLGEAHDNGLIHRDIKPANIVVTGTGTELDFAKVLDFGLVRFNEHDKAGPAKLTGEGTVAGTPAYTAPEIALGEASYDHRVDIYAIGCVGYWLLTGQLVFERDTAMKMMVDHATAVPAPPHTRTELPIPDDLERVILDCLEKEPSRRPHTARQLAERLAACQVDGRWTRERAEQWWSTHLPEPVRSRPVSEVLVSHEANRDGARELRPRRAARMG